MLQNRLPVQCCVAHWCEEIGSGNAFPLRGELDAASVHVENIEVRDGDGDFSCWVLMIPGLVWMGARRCRPSAGGFKSRKGLHRNSLAEAGAGDRRTTPLIFQGETITVSDLTGSTR
jgi:hypothetical protein